MIESFIFLILFGIIHYLVRNITYKLLFLGAILNVLAYPYTSETSVVIQATLDFVLVLALIRYADMHYWYQTGLLLLSLFVHFVCELDQLFGANIIFSNYDAALTLITIAQLSGAGYAVIFRYFERIWNDSDNRILFYHDCSETNKECQKEQQKY